MINKVLIVAAAVIGITLSGFIIGLKIQLSEARADNLELTAEIARKETQIAQAEGAIRSQNEAAESFRNDMEAKASGFKSDYDRLNKKYQLAIKKSSDILGKEPDCTAQLKAIYEAQEAFCYE